ncbi:hypothetical protein Salat_1899100 [Sesamum alatum]|uniref:Uncharacterized protein n=1 Tax=Sesamum alatum TaxID=300844 RepID=A0AAE1Y4W1_9LAMI|nr:hypothetical protein Salat_1899100 [Sesamum alatum]
MDDLERLLEEVVQRGAKAAIMTNRRSRWGPRNQVRRSPRQEEKKDMDSVGSSRAPSPKKDLSKGCFEDNPDVNELRREVAELKAAIKPPANFTKGNPFSEDILNEPVPLGTRIPQGKGKKKDGRRSKPSKEGYRATTTKKNSKRHRRRRLRWLHTIGPGKDTFGNSYLDASW